MNEQLSIYDVCSDSDHLSLQTERSDAKKQAIQRFLSKGKKDPSVSVNKYSPGRRSTEYYRVSFEWLGKKKHIHLKGGNTRSKLAIYRAEQLTQLIERGAELEEVIAAVSTFNSGGEIKPTLGSDA